MLLRKELLWRIGCIGHRRGDVGLRVGSIKRSKATRDGKGWVHGTRRSTVGGREDGGRRFVCGCRDQKRAVRTFCEGRDSAFAVEDIISTFALLVVLPC